MSAANEGITENIMQKTSCKNFNAIATKDPQNDGNMKIARLRCKQWDCEYCARKNMSIWRAHILQKLNEMGGEWCFITLTAHANAHKAGKTVLNLKAMWKKLYDRLQRRYKREWFTPQLYGMEYVMLFEKHTQSGKGTYHIHAIVRMRVEGKNQWDAKRKNWYHAALTMWLKDNAAECGGGFMAHGAKIMEANAGLVAAYITKYMTKNAQGFEGFPKGQRRITTSRGFGSPDTTGEGGWRFRNYVLIGEYYAYDSITDVSTGERLNAASFGLKGLYPTYEGNEDDD